jgi:hypothetical protein
VLLIKVGSRLPRLGVARVAGVAADRLMKVQRRGLLSSLFSHSLSSSLSYIFSRIFSALETVLSGLVDRTA